MAKCISVSVRTQVGWIDRQKDRRTDEQTILDQPRKVFRYNKKWVSLNFFLYVAYIYYI